MSVYFKHVGSSGHLALMQQACCWKLQPPDFQATLPLGTELAFKPSASLETEFETPSTPSTINGRVCPFLGQVQCGAFSVPCLMRLCL